MSLKAPPWQRNGLRRRALACGRQGRGGHLARSGWEVLPVGVSRAPLPHPVLPLESGLAAAGRVALGGPSC